MMGRKKPMRRGAGPKISPRQAQMMMARMNPAQRKKAMMMAQQFLTRGRR